MQILFQHQDIQLDQPVCSQCIDVVKVLLRVELRSSFWLDELNPDRVTVVCVCVCVCVCVL